MAISLFQAARARSGPGRQRMKSECREMDAGWATGVYGIVRVPLQPCTRLEMSHRRNNLLISCVYSVRCAGSVLPASWATVVLPSSMVDCTYTSTCLTHVHAPTHRTHAANRSDPHAHFAHGTRAYMCSCACVLMRSSPALIAART